MDGVYDLCICICAKMGVDMSELVDSMVAIPARFTAAFKLVPIAM